METKIPINEIFASVDGEVNNYGQGFPTIFVRTQGCNLRCDYCDTKQTWKFETDKLLSVNQIFDIIKQSGFSKVTITGGEPLVHPGVLKLCEILIESEYKVSVETNGTLPIPKMDDWIWSGLVDWIVDFKVDLYRYNHVPFIKILPGKDSFFQAWIKFVIGNYDDFLLACCVMQEVKSSFPVASIKFALSPIHNKLSVERVFSWMIEHKNNFPELLENTSINTQLHKFIFPKGEKNHILY